MIDFERQVVILHPPKTGGVAVQHALGIKMPLEHEEKIVYRHETLAELRLKFPEIRKWPTAILTRHPYDRLESMFYFARLEGFLPTTNALRKQIIAAPSLEDWIQETDFIEVFMRPTTVFGLHLKPMFWYMTGKDVTQIPLENRQQHLRDFLGDNSVRVNRENANPHKPAKWTQEMKDIVYEAFGADFRTFGYER